MESIINDFVLTPKESIALYLIMNQMPVVTVSDAIKGACKHSGLDAENLTKIHAEVFLKLHNFIGLNIPLTEMFSIVKD